MQEIANIRSQYTKFKLSIKEVDSNPIIEFKKWFEEVLKTNAKESTIMTLSTVSPNGKPYSRVVLLKEIEKKGFVFYTNYQSRKGHHIEINPWVCLIFFWEDFQRQVHILGKAIKVNREKSDTYFNNRPRESRIGAYASEQSAPLANRKVLEDNYKAFSKKFTDSDFIPCPSYWGGYCVEPTLMEFWQGRVNRLHDRIEYTLQSDNTWKIRRLSP